ncbi:MAG: ABC transporter substrate-binding protein [Chthonomonas sp.]|nr:ABC transporter substrate-binding protein [Chthonomonas sp.]
MRWASVAVLAILVMAGCKEESNGYGGRPRPKIYQKVVSLSPSMSELSSKMDLQLAGRTAACNWPDTLKALPVVCEVKPNYELLASMKPDLVIVDGSLFSDAEISKVKEASKAEVVEMNVHTVKELTDFLDSLAGKVGGELSAHRYIDQIETAVRTAKLDAGAQPKNAIILMGNGVGNYMIAGRSSFTADLIRSAGANVLGPDDDKFAPANLEQIITWNPDVIFVPGSAAAIMKDPRLASLKAVKNGAVAGANADLLLRAGSRVDGMISRATQFIQQGK